MIVVVDGRSVIDRAFHGIPKFNNVRNGQPNNAVKGFAAKLLQLTRAYEPTWAVVAFDTKLSGALGPSSTCLPHQAGEICQVCGFGCGYRRRMQYAAYKAKRNPTDPQLVAQFDDCRRVAEVLGYHWIESRGWEADDILATVVVSRTDRREPIILVSSDKDILPLIRFDGVSVLSPGHPMSGGDTLYDRDAVFRKYGMPPEHLVTYRALVGDPSDNVPGVEGIGEKAATAIVQKLGGDLDEIYRVMYTGRWEDVFGGDKQALRWRKLLYHGREEAYLTWKLVTLDAVVPHVPPLVKLRRVPAARDEMRRVFAALDLPQLAIDEEANLCQVPGLFAGVK